MSRLSLLSGFVPFLLSSFLLPAQELPPDPRPLHSTPDVLRQVAEAERTIDSLPAEEKVTARFQLLSFLVRLDDKAPAKGAIETILQLVPTIPREMLQQQLLEAISYTQGDIGDFDAALKTVERLAKPDNRANARLAIVEKIRTMEKENKPEKPFDVLPVLEKAVAETVESKNAGLEAVARAMLGREFAKQGKMDEARAAFLDARKKAREIEAVEERNVIAMIVKSEIQTGLIPEALAVVETVTDEEMKQGIAGYAVVILIQEGKAEQADKLLETIPAGDLRDNVLLGIVRETADTITVEKILNLAGRLSAPDRKELFLINAVRTLLENDKPAVAAELAGHLENAAQIQAELRVRQMENLLEEKKFDDAQKLVDAFEDEQIKRAAMRYVLMARFKDGNIEEVQKLAEATFSEEDKQQIEQLRKESEKAAQTGDADERMAAFSEILQAQFGLFDLFGARKTLGLMLQTAESLSDPAQSVKYRIALSMLQSQLSDSGRKENLNNILKYLDGIDDIMKLAGLVPEEQESAPTADDPAQPLVVLKNKVDEAAIVEQLFEVYLTVASELGNADDIAGAKKAFDKAKALAENESNPIQKTQKMLLLTQLIAELETPVTEEK